MLFYVIIKFYKTYFIILIFFFHENYFYFFMFWNVPACYGMFHVPDFIDALLLPTLPPFGGVLLYYVSIKFGGVTPCGAVESAWPLPTSFWHCLYLAILFICLNLVRSSPKGSVNTLVLPHGSGVFLLCA